MVLSHFSVIFECISRLHAPLAAATPPLTVVWRTATVLVRMISCATSSIKQFSTLLTSVFIPVARLMDMELDRDLCYLLKGLVDNAWSNGMESGGNGVGQDLRRWDFTIIVSVRHFWNVVDDMVNWGRQRVSAEKWEDGSRPRGWNLGNRSGL